GQSVGDQVEVDAGQERPDAPKVARAPRGYDGRVEILIVPTAGDAERLAARIVADRLRDKPDLVLGCATGATMEGIYAKLVDLHREANLSFARATTFNLDEYVGLPAEDERSYHHYMRRHLFDHVDLAAENTHLPDGMAEDLAAEARAYEAAIQVAGGVDLPLLGLGRTGLLGFKQHTTAFVSRHQLTAFPP